jgi:hypothetical protein
MAAVYSKDQDIVFRRIADEVLLVPIRNNIHNLESIHALNSVGARIWELIDGTRTVDQIKDLIVEEFEINPKKAGKDLEEFLASLASIHAIKET